MKAGAWIPALWLTFLSAIALAQSPQAPIAKIEPTVPRIIVRELTFEGATKLPVPDQDLIAAEVKAREYGWPMEWREDLSYRITDGWQRHGFLLATAKPHYRLLLNEGWLFEVAVRAEIHEGPQYRLGGFRWKNLTVFSAAELEPSFPIVVGELVDTRKVAAGMNAVRELYWARGYINFTFVPAGYAFDDEQQTAEPILEVDEGQPFRVGGIDIVSTDAVLQERLRSVSRLKHGDIFDLRLWHQFLRDVDEIAPSEAYPVVNGWVRPHKRTQIADIHLFIGFEAESESEDSQVEVAGSEPEEEPSTWSIGRYRGQRLLVPEKQYTNEFPSQ
ncbi:MAG TPA: POTRA domain-containing protein [Terriglobales bacterium]|nr:POTRA domain-containing protein [Terriglobales bacterium]